MTTIFDENFSFLSSGFNSRLQNHPETDSSSVSPFTSRCSSPDGLLGSRSRFSAQPHYKRPETRFYNSSRIVPRQATIANLTAQLEAHALSSTSDCSNDSPLTYSPVSTSPSSPLELDEGFSEPASPGLDPPLWDLSMSDLDRTSHPCSIQHFALRRQQRQALTRLQCLAKRAPDLAMLIEECHPSSLPLPAEASRSAKRTASMSSLGRIEKEKSPAAVVRRAPRMRKRATR